MCFLNSQIMKKFQSVHENLKISSDFAGEHKAETFFGQHQDDIKSFSFRHIV